MSSPWWSALLLLVSLIPLCSTTSSASQAELPLQPSHYSTNLSVLKRELLTDESRAQTEKVLEIATSSLSLLNDVMGNFDTKQLKGMMKNLANFASVAPGIGAVISSVVNTILAFIPQDDPVMKKLEEGFSEVNRKLDSISTQISDLEAEMELQIYASQYAHVENQILNGWQKFVELIKSGPNNFNKAAMDFKKIYKSENIEVSVANLHRYLTVRSTSLNKNIIEMLKKKYKCDLSEINRYNLFLSSLLWKGVVLKEVYGKLSGKNSGKEAEHAQMFKSVFEAQQAVVEYCLNHSEEYMRKDVEEIARAHSPEKKEEIAEKVKNTLDKKYSWYNWVVLVYDNNDEKTKYIIIVDDMTKIPIDNIIVAVTYTLKADPDKEKETEGVVTELVEECFEQNKNCKIPCKIRWGHNPTPKMTHLNDYAKVTHATYKYKYAESPPPVKQSNCLIDGYTYQIFVHNSRKLPVCEDQPCKNNGQCKQLLKSNEWLCVCQNGYHGNTCEKKMSTTVPQIKARPRARLKAN
ncbi:hypothetical protein SRHO_G00130280 [Serrasalmus rhombeus]